MSLFFNMVTAGGSGYVITAPNVTVSADDFISPYDSFVGIRFLTNGTYQTRSQVNGIGNWTHAGNWITPISAASGVTVHVRYTQRLGSGDFDSGAAEDAWVEIDSTRAWGWTETIGVLESFITDFELSLDAGSSVEDVDSNEFVIENS